MSKIIKASEFKAKCLGLMDEVARTGESFVITKNGTPIAQLAPLKQKKSPFGILKDELVIVGDIMSPLDVEWDAMK
jgi:prevent-host-death family protein